MPKYRRNVFASAAILIACATVGPTQAAQPSIWRKGTGIAGTCRAVVAGRTVMDGGCSGLGHGNSIFVTAETDGCSIELTRSSKGVSGKVFAYKNDCPELDDEAGLGAFSEDGGCWKSASAKVCLQPRR